MNKTTIAGCNPVERELGIQNKQTKPTFKEWLQHNKIELTPSEIIDWTMLAARKGVSVKKLIGYPYA